MFIQLFSNKKDATCQENVSYKTLYEIYLLYHIKYKILHFFNCELTFLYHLHFH